MNKKGTQRINLGGNFCGHHPLHPRLELAIPPKTGKKGIPPILSLLINCIRDYYHDGPKLIPSLDRANGSNRKQRSCRREACVQLLSAMVKFCDLVTLKVGIPTKDGFKNLSLETLAKHAGLSISRAERAFADIKKAGLFSSTPVCEEKDDGCYRGLPSVKTISKEVFAIFGLNNVLEKERKKASRRLTKKQEAWSIEETKTPSIAHLARIKLSIGGILKRLPAFGKQLSGKQSNAPPDYDRERRVQKKALELSLEHPEWTPNQCRKEAEKLV